MKNCETCDRHPCEGHHKEFCKFHPDNLLVNFGPDGGNNYWIKKKWKLVVTASMVEDLLHRNKVDIEFLAKDIKKYNERINSRTVRIEELLNARANLLKELEKVEQNEM